MPDARREGFISIIILVCLLLLASHSQTLWHPTVVDGWILKASRQRRGLCRNVNFAPILFNPWFIPDASVFRLHSVPAAEPIGFHVNACVHTGCGCSAFQHRHSTGDPETPTEDTHFYFCQTPETWGIKSAQNRERRTWSRAQKQNKAAGLLSK